MNPCSIASSRIDAYNEKRARIVWLAPECFSNRRISCFGGHRQSACEHLGEALRKGRDQRPRRRSHPLLSLRSKKPMCWSSQYVRRGTRTLLASLEIATGKVTPTSSRTGNRPLFSSSWMRLRPSRRINHRQITTNSPRSRPPVFVHRISRLASSNTSTSVNREPSTRLPAPQCSYSHLMNSDINFT